MVVGGSEMGPTTTMLDTINTEIEILTSDDLMREVLSKETIARLYPKLAAAPPAGSSLADAAEKGVAGRPQRWAGEAVERHRYQLAQL